MYGLGYKLVYGLGYKLVYGLGCKLVYGLVYKFFLFKTSKLYYIFTAMDNIWT